MKMAGVGHSPLRQCMGCNIPRPQTGGRGLGVKWRCIHCVRTVHAHKVAA